MPFQFLSNYFTQRESRIEADYELPSGTIVAVRNSDYAYGTVGHWGTLMAMDYALLSGNDPLFYSQVNLYQKAHAIALVSPNGVTVQPAIYIPKSYRRDVVTFALYQWVDP